MSSSTESSVGSLSAYNITRLHGIRWVRFPPARLHSVVVRLERVVGFPPTRLHSVVVRLKRVVVGRSFLDAGGEPRVPRRVPRQWTLRCRFRRQGRSDNAGRSHVYVAHHACAVPAVSESCGSVSVRDFWFVGRRPMARRSLSERVDALGPPAGLLRRGGHPPVGLNASQPAK